MPQRHLILVVDDDQDVRESISEALLERGHEVTTAADGAQALELLRRPPFPCLVLLDLMMPIMDGRVFLQERQSEPDLAGIPVVILTASRGSAVAGLTSVPVVQKPFELSLLEAIVRRYCAFAGPD